MAPAFAELPAPPEKCGTPRFLVPPPVGVRGVVVVVPLGPEGGWPGPPGAGVGVFVGLPTDPRNGGDSGRREREAGQAPSPEAAEAPRLDLAIEIFDPGVEDRDSRNADPALPAELTPAEARFVSTELRRTLEDTGSWGTVRVIPVSGDGFDVIVSGTMLHSGSKLVLQIEARDALGRRRRPEVYGETDGASRAELYDRIAADLLAWRREAGPKSLETIRHAALLHFGARLVPETFARYLEPQESPTGIAPAPDLEDSLRQRLTNVSERDRLYLTILNEHYLALHDSMAGPYHEWRENPSGRAQEPRVQLLNLWRSFEATGPTSVVDLEGVSRQLRGSVEDQFLSWRALARQVLGSAARRP
jgi:hypothetical protein